MWEAALHGFILAWGLILPLGVQNVFVFNQGAAQPKLARALPAVVTAAICDTLLILLAVLGVSLIVLSLAWLKTILYAVGTLFLAYMGWSIWRSEPPAPGNASAGVGVRKQIMFALSVSLLNPHAILDTIGVIGTSSLSYEGYAKAGFAAAAIAVSWIWFAGLAVAGRGMGRLDSSGRLLLLMNKLSAVVVWVMAVYMVKMLVFP
ncbi:lysine transporter LysE [Paenibacillus sp. CAA11]|uniref:LysE/ArgO family amino acid transporter n=1 Tax=Paenibacillus sp. CAA11 TaxID=1532905 RepID=UPI000D36E468|nr:LysE family transporter [Paenibacillus sp. CAA11]AWB43193.1 lysine transporter LysE [Paenibacillus sp. CAA11]